jgi:hypothetical protein
MPTVTITMSQPTVDALQRDKFWLHALKAVKASPRNGFPVVWFATTSYDTQTTVAWQHQYQAFTSLSLSLPGSTVEVAYSYPVAMGDILNVTSDAGSGDVSTGLPGTVSVLNATTPPNFLACGLSQINPAGVVAPVCVSPLLLFSQDTFVPVEQVLLVFTAVGMKMGQSVGMVLAQSALIDLTPEPEVGVTFDIATGWGLQPSVSILKPGADLVPLLVQ